MNRKTRTVLWVALTAILAAFSEAVLWIANDRYGRFIDNTNVLGLSTFFSHIPGMWVAARCGLRTLGDDRAANNIMVMTGALQFFLVYAGIILLSKTRGKAKWVLLAVLLAVLSEAMMWGAYARYLRLSPDGSTVGLLAFYYHCPGMWVKDLQGLKEFYDDDLTNPMMLAIGALQFFLAYGCIIALWVRRHKRPRGHPDETR